MSIETTRNQWDREKASWPAAIELAGKRKRLGLSLHAKLGTKDDPYLAYLTDLEQGAYLNAITGLTDPKRADAAEDVIWRLRALVVERTPLKEGNP